MGTLNDIPSYLQDNQKNDWTPASGFVKGLTCSSVTALVMAGALCIVTGIWPACTTMVWVESIISTLVLGAWNAVVGFFIACILFAVIHKYSGQVARWCNYSVVILSFLVIAAKHLVLVKVGVPGGLHDMEGWAWMNPINVVLTNLGAWVGICIAVVMFKNGDTLRDYLGIN